MCFALHASVEHVGKWAITMKNSARPQHAEDANSTTLLQPVRARALPTENAFGVVMRVIQYGNALGFANQVDNAFAARNSFQTNQAVSFAAFVQQSTCEKTMLLSLVRPKGKLTF